MARPQSVLCSEVSLYIMHAIKLHRQALTSCTIQKLEWRSAWGIKARSVKACVVSNKRSKVHCLYMIACLDFPEQLLNCQYRFKVQGCD